MKATRGYGKRMQQDESGFQGCIGTLTRSSCTYDQVTRSWTEARRQSHSEAGPSGRQPQASSQLLPAVERLVADDGGRWLAAVGTTQVHVFDLGSQQHHARLPLPQVFFLFYSTRLTTALSVCQ